MNDMLTRKTFAATAKAVGDRQVETIASTATLDLDNSEADVLAAFRSPALRSAIAEDVARRMQWALTPADAHVLILDDEDEVGLTPADVRAVLAVVGGLATAEVNRQLPAMLNRLRGKID
jgi:ribosome biogenesis SPOUT family RNA methylase Rps3